MSDEGNPLELFTMDELVDEIRRRHSHVLMLVVQDGKVQSENIDVISRYCKGGSWALMGLCEVYRSWAAAQYFDDDGPTTTT